MIYLDANATEPLRPRARTAMLAAADLGGNPASVHGAGRAARRILEDARDVLAARFGAVAANIVFTSGATESCAQAIRVLGRDRRIIVGATEHDAVRAAAPDRETLPVDPDGRVDLAALAELLQGAPALVCVMLANNETGTIQAVDSVAALCRSAGARLFVDAAQAAGRMHVDFSDFGADAFALSSHKLGGPAGAGALVLAPAHASIPALIAGGGQERGRRGGTPPLPAIAGFAAAATDSADYDTGAIAALRDAAEQAAGAVGAVVIGGGAQRLPNTTCLALAGVPAETQVIGLDLAGIAVSAGAACSSGKVARSHVLNAMGLGALAGEAIRVSLPWSASAADVDVFVDAYASMVRRLRARRAA